MLPDADGQPAQPLHLEDPEHGLRGIVDIDEALAAATPLLEVWWEVRKHPDAPPFSGGVWDAWPARDADVCALAREEEQLIRDLVRWKREVKRRGRPAAQADR